MADPKPADSIVIKRIKKGGHGHHGGAWKVAYADFVTAMMAFFLLLWLLSTTTPEQRLGIAEYFTPTVGMKDAKGIGFQGGLTPNEPGTSKSALSQPGLVVGQVQQGPIPQDPTPVQELAPTQESSAESDGMAMESAPPKPDESKSESEKEGSDAELKQVKEEILSAFENQLDLQRFKNNILVTVTPEGLKIDLMDDEKKTLFLPDTSTMTDMARTMVRAVGSIIIRSTNHVSITGHSEQRNYPAGAPYTAWELTADRANTVRRYLSGNIVEADRVTRVAGMADSELLVPKEPLAPRNRRISLLLLRSSHMTAAKGMSAQRGLLSVPEYNP